MRLILMTILLVGCADDDDRGYLKAETTCGADWSDENADGESCDAACDPRVEQTEPGCETTHIGPMGGSVGPVVCQSTFTIDGERGCCTQLFIGQDLTIDASEGEPSRRRRVFFLTCK